MRLPLKTFQIQSMPTSNEAFERGTFNNRSLTYLRPLVLGLLWLRVGLLLALLCLFLFLLLTLLLLCCVVLVLVLILVLFFALILILVLVLRLVLRLVLLLLGSFLADRRPSR